MVIHPIFPIIINIIFFKKIFCNGIIKIPFHKDLPNLEGLSPEDIIEKIKDNSLIVELNVGTPPQKVELQLEFTEYISFICGKTSLSRKKFIETDSQTYKKISDSIYFSILNIKEAYLSNDIFYFGEKSQEKKNLNFLLGIDTDKSNSGGKIGLNIQDEDTKKYEKYNFINILKSGGVIKDYFFNIKYNDRNYGDLIIGDLPHNYNSSYNSKDFKDMYISMNNGLTWNINLDSIYVADDLNSEKKKIVGEKIYGYFKLEVGIILGTERYRLNLLNDFMSEKIDKGLCFEIVSFFYITYYCKPEVDLSKLKNLYIYVKDLDYTFELNYKDLFYKSSDGKNFFLIYFNTDYDGSEDSSDYFWTFGEPFLRKYNLIFNQDIKRIGLYKKQNSGNNNDIKEKKKSFWARNKWYIILIIVLFIICGGLGLMIFLYFKALPKRKMKANELEDDFEYSSKDKYIIN